MSWTTRPLRAICKNGHEWVIPAFSEDADCPQCKKASK